MPPKKLPSQKLLRELFDYDRAGYLVRKKSPIQKAIGLRAGGVSACGYRYTWIGPKSYRTHRLIWKWHFGTEPKLIDHINQIRHDNRIENLRPLSASLNKMNGPAYKNNKSGTKGVYLTRFGTWACGFRKDRKYIHLGTFKTKILAVVAFADARGRDF